MGELKKLVEEGKIKYIGLSSVTDQLCFGKNLRVSSLELCAVGRSS